MSEEENVIMDDFTAAEFMDGRSSRTDAAREARCKTFCRFRKKHKCLKHGCRIVNAPCDPIAEYMKQGEKADEMYRLRLF